MRLVIQTPWPGVASVAKALMARSGRALAHFVAKQGSVAIDGVPPTVNDMDSETFGAHIIPYTASVTSLGTTSAGNMSNLESDTLARYAARLSEAE